MGCFRKKTNTKDEMESDEGTTLVRGRALMRWHFSRVLKEYSLLCEDEGKSFPGVGAKGLI